MMYRPPMTTKKLPVAVFALAAALTLSACGGTDSGTKAQAAPSSATETVAPSTEAPTTAPAASTTHDFGDLTAEIVSVAAEPAEAWVSEDHPGHDTMVTVTIRLKADDKPVPLKVDPLGSTGPKAQLLYGPNGQLAQGYAADNGDTTDLPSQVTPGSPVDLTEEFSLPHDGLSQLSVAFTPDAEQGDNGYVFNGVQALL